MSDKFKIGADATVAAGPVGRQAAAGTDVKLNAEILSYSRSKGVFAGASVDGAVVQADHSGDQAMYGSNVTAGKYWTAKPRFLSRRGDCWRNLQVPRTPLKSAGRH